MIVVEAWIVVGIVLGMGKVYMVHTETDFPDYDGCERAVAAAMVDLTAQGYRPSLTCYLE